MTHRSPPWVQVPDPMLLGRAPWGWEPLHPDPINALSQKFAKLCTDASACQASGSARVPQDFLKRLQSNWYRAICCWGERHEGRHCCKLTRKASQINAHVHQGPSL